MAEIGEPADYNSTYSFFHCSFCFFSSLILGFCFQSENERSQLFAYLANLQKEQQLAQENQTDSNSSSSKSASGKMEHSSRVSVQHRASDASLDEDTEEGQATQLQDLNENEEGKESVVASMPSPPPSLSPAAFTIPCEDILVRYKFNWQKRLNEVYQFIQTVCAV
jgi:hypothetical protein